MPLKIVKLGSLRYRVLLIFAVLACVTAVWFAIKWNFAAAVIARLDPERPDSRIIAEWVTEIAPNDPNAHFATAVILEKTFDPGDLEKSLAEYEKAAVLSPHHYVIWLNLARSRSVAGDVEGAESAFRRALELAPNYSTVQWAFGNFLIRQDRVDEGFELIAKAAAAEPKYAGPAVVTAMQLNGNNVGRVTQLLGHSESIISAIVAFHAAQGQFDAAMEAWSGLPPETRLIKFKEQTDKLLAQIADAKKFRLAARLAAEMRGDQTERPVVGQVANGGFESDIRLRDAPLFTWKISEGAEPQVHRADGQRHSGGHSLQMIFNTFETAGFRSMEQTVAVEPGTKYELELFYRSDLKTAATLTWEVVDAATGAILATTPPLVATSDWIPLRAAFAAPEAADGIIIRLSRSGCNGPSCPMNGKVSFDDLALRRL